MGKATSPVVDFDVFNGDADGICALHQLRLARPCDATLVTGVKRDIALVARVPAKPGVHITVLDVSFDANRAAVVSALAAGASVDYFDHHDHGSNHVVPDATHLRLVWSDAPDICTSLLVDAEVGGRYRPWAIVGAFGDNLVARARSLAAACGYTRAQAAQLERIGRLVNYNAYGETLADLHIAPDALYRALHAFADPFAFAESAPCFEQLAHGYDSDNALADATQPVHSGNGARVYLLPDACWARRVSGTFANRIADARPDTAFAVLTATGNDRYVVSVRSADPQGQPAHAFCERFGGGGRRRAAGINALAATEVPGFIDAFAREFERMRHA
jgi:hypothetical protein